MIRTIETQDFRYRLHSQQACDEMQCRAQCPERCENSVSSSKCIQCTIRLERLNRDPLENDDRMLSTNSMIQKYNA